MGVEKLNFISSLQVLDIYMNDMCRVMKAWLSGYLVLKPGNKTAVPSWSDPYTESNLVIIVAADATAPVTFYIKLVQYSKYLVSTVDTNGLMF